MVDTADNQQEEINAELDIDDAGGAKLFERSRIKALAGELVMFDKFTVI